MSPKNLQPYLKKHSLEHTLYHFAKKHFVKRKVLIGLSGGPDSMALFYLLLWLQPYIPTKIVVAHVNHQLRKESDSEEKILKNLCAEKKCLFYSTQLSLPATNLEGQARIERYTFFQKIHQNEKLEACLLGHHMDDQAETVLKRVFEGSQLIHLRGMLPLTNWDDMPLFRPLLAHTKQEIVDWLEKHSLPYFEDESNKNGDNLRAKMRRDLIPALSSHFGKNIAKPLKNLSAEAQELEDYLNTKVPQSKEFSGKTTLYLSNLKPLHPFPLKWLLTKWLKSFHLTATKDLMEKLVQRIHKTTSTKLFSIGNHKLIVSNIEIQLVQD